MSRGLFDGRGLNPAQDGDLKFSRQQRAERGVRRDGDLQERVSLHHHGPAKRERRRVDRPDSGQGSAGRVRRRSAWPDLAMLSGNALDIDVVVSDVAMPGRIDGLGLAQEISRHWPKLPVLLVSGYANNLDEARARGVPVLTKPFALTELAETVRELCQAHGSGPASSADAASSG